MPKGKLEFNLPEERSDFELASNATKWYLVAWDMDEYLRSLTKYASDDETQERIDAFQEVRDRFWEIMNDRNLNFDES
jgi:adenosyl cobinamide kinase/adenosyl cobinamide phosphate guanylyltransferase